jgi:NAD(P)-dependent dehydrogenase (short-subunit alcohol dehydrogenase family)
VSGRLEGRRAVVTGAARGIGFAIAQRFVTEGAAVALVDIQPEAVKAAGTALDDAPCFVADVADAADAKGAVVAAADALGGLDVLVNNAGILHMAPLLEIEPEDWDRTFAVNVRSMLLTIQAAVPLLRASERHGKIINMTSMGGKLGAPGQAHYCASKAAVIELTRVAAMELGPLGITVNCICPGYVLTDMGAATRTPEMVAAWSAKSPLGRLGTPEDVAGMALFLASADGDYCTGQAMNVTGGMVMH